MPGHGLLLEWRPVAGAGTGCCADLRCAAEAVDLVAGIAKVTCYGEYRVRGEGGQPVYTTAALIREWGARGDTLPEAFTGSLWKREVEHAMAVEKMMFALRRELTRAVATGLLSNAAARSILHAIRRATTERRSCDDLPHGRLSLRA